MILEETKIGSSKPFLSPVVLPEQVRLEPLLECVIQTVSVSDGGGELIPHWGARQEKSLCWDRAVRPPGGCLKKTVGGGWGCKAAGET